MKALRISYFYYAYPENCATLEDFIAFLNQNYHSFIRLTKFDNSSCCFPYFIQEDVQTVYCNVAELDEVSEEDITVLPRDEYKARLKAVIESKCVHCQHYTEELGDANFRGHWSNINLDGECDDFDPVCEEDKG